MEKQEKGEYSVQSGFPGQTGYSTIHPTFMPNAYRTSDAESGNLSVTRVIRSFSGAAVEALGKRAGRRILPRCDPRPVSWALDDSNRVTADG